MLKLYGVESILKNQTSPAFQVFESDVVQLRAISGSGRSALLRQLAGINTQRLFFQSLELCGRPISRGFAWKRVQQGVAYLTQRPLRFMTLREEDLIGLKTKSEAAQRIERYKNFLKCFSIKDPNTFRESQLAALCRVLIDQPKLILLDEAFSHLTRDDLMIMKDLIQQETSKTAFIIAENELDLNFPLETTQTWRLETAAHPGRLRPLKTQTAISFSQIDRIKLRNIQLGDQATGMLKIPELGINQGEILGLLGRSVESGLVVAKNFFGLSTGAKVQGSLSIDQQEIPIGDVEALAKQGVVLVSGYQKRFGLFLGQSALFNLSLPYFLFKQGDSFREKKLAEKRLWSHYSKLFKLNEKQRFEFVFELSKLDRAKLLIARWLPLKPKLIVLDDIQRGLDYSEAREIMKIVERVAADGVSVLFLSNSAELHFEFSHRIYIVKKGDLHSTNSENFSEPSDLIAAYHTSGENA